MKNNMKDLLDLIGKFNELEASIDYQTFSDDEAIKSENIINSIIDIVARSNFDYQIFKISNEQVEIYISDLNLLWADKDLNIYCHNSITDDDIKANIFKYGNNQSLKYDLIKHFEEIERRRGKFYVDKQFKDPIYGDYYSYEGKPLDNKYFDSEEEAKAYAEKKSYLLADNEKYEILKVEE